MHCRVFSASRVVGVRTPLFIFFATPDVGRLAGNFAAREGFCGGGSVSDSGPVRKFLVWAWWWGPPCPRLSRDPGGPVPRPKVTGCSPLTRGAVPRTSTPGRFDSRKVRLGARRPADRSPGSGSGRVAAQAALRGEPPGGTLHCGGWEGGGSPGGTLHSAGLHTKVCPAFEMSLGEWLRSPDLRGRDPPRGQGGPHHHALVENFQAPSPASPLCLGEVQHPVPTLRCRKKR